VPIDFSLPSHVEQSRRDIADFIDTVVIPREQAAFVAEGGRDTEPSPRAKVFVSEAVSRIVDRSVQLCGGLGTTTELVVGRIYVDMRAFRIYDGASEVHRMSIAKRAARRAAAGRPQLVGP